MTDTGTDKDHYSLVSLGCGEAGKYIAWTYKSRSPAARCAVVEQQWLGGSCPNIACLPSKNIVHSAKVASYAQHLSYFGLAGSQNAAPGPPVDMAVVRERKRDMVRGLISTHEGRFAATGVEVVMGRGVFTGDRTIEVALNDGGKRTITADTVIVCTGSRASIDTRISGLKDAKPLTHIELLEMDTVPAHLIVLGGGYIGLEFAQAMGRFGSKVSVVEHHDRILNREDTDVSSALADILSKEGVEFFTSTQISHVTGRSGDSVKLTGTRNGQPLELSGSHILVATGRTPNTQDLGLEAAGIQLTASGHVKVDERLRTTCPGVFAVGDCAGSPHFTHVAFDDFRVVVDNLIGSKTKTTAGRQLPYTLFTDPELAHVGLPEAEAKARGIPYRLAKLPMLAFLRTRTLGETQGFAKLLVAADGDAILGFTALGPGAGELLAPVQLVMAHGLPYTSLGELIVTHPTLAEGLVYLAMAVPAVSPLHGDSKKA